jgi:hypothetical protein
MVYLVARLVAVSFGHWWSEWWGDSGTDLGEVMEMIPRKIVEGSAFGSSRASWGEIAAVMALNICLVVLYRRQESDLLHYFILSTIGFLPRVHY